MDINYQKVKETYKILLENQKLDFKRFLYEQIDYKQRLIGIVGPRGVGKTTLILQYLKENYLNDDKALYIIADNVIFSDGELVKLANDFYHKQGGRLLCIDEIHRYKNWNQELKNIYDSLPDLKIIFSGSSSLDLVKGKYDLSRRGVLYNLPGLSFREYLNFSKKTNLPKYSLEKLLSDYQNISIDLLQIKSIIKHFNEYLEFGYYPFFQETNNKLLYYQQLKRIIDKIINEDIASFYNLKTQNLITFKQIINFLATISPGKLSINKLASSLGKNHNTISEYLNILQEASLIRFLSNDKIGHAFIRHAKKVYLDNTNLLFAVETSIGKNEDRGMVRELFVLNQLVNANLIPVYTEKSDFEINGNILEVGGKNKNDKQIMHIDKSFLVLDDIITAEKGKIPLYLFGFLY